MMVTVVVMAAMAVRITGMSHDEGFTVARSAADFIVRLVTDHSVASGFEDESLSRGGVSSTR